MQQTRIANSCGYSLLEAMASVLIITVAVMSSLVLVGRRSDVMTDSYDQLSLVLARNEIIGHLQRNYTWNFDLIPSTDTSFNCIRNIASTDTTARTCVATTSGTPFNVYDNRGQIIFEGSDPTAGITMSGEFCKGYAATGAGNGLCPIRLNLTWNPICPSGVPCEDPVIEINGKFSFNNGKRAIASDISRFDFTVQRNHLYCPPQVAPSSPVNISGSIVTATSIVSSNPGAAPGAATASLTDPLLTCQKVELYFRDTMNNGSAMPPTIPNNKTQVCLATAASPTTCVYEYRRTYDNASSSNIFTLYYKGALKYTRAASVPYTSSTDLRFRIDQGLVRFCVDTTCVYTFDQKATGLMKMYFSLPAAGISPNGLTNILLRTF